MSRESFALIKRGQGIYQGDKIDLENLSSPNYEGHIFRFEAYNAEYPDLGDSTGRYVDTVILRNRSGMALKPGRLVRFASTGLYPYGTAVDGYATGAAGEQVAGFVDDWWGPAGVPNGDLFACIYRGPTRAVTAKTGTISIAAGSILVPGTGTSATNDDAGRVAVIGNSPTAADLDSRVGIVDVLAASAPVTGNDALFAVYARLNKF